MSNEITAINGIEIQFRPANPLLQAKPPIPELKQQTVLYKKGSVNAKGAMPLPIDIECVQDIEIPMRDGVKLYGDLWRKAGDASPVPAILVFTPYSKQGGPFNANYDVTSTGFPKDKVSGLQRFESPDPAYWCQHGYSIILVDERGISHSGGDLHFMGSQAEQDVYDTIEWIAIQSWCSGKVTMMGNSQLAMIQWTAAAAKPPHLAAIAPWEGLTDEYRDCVARGGIPNYDFHDVDIIALLYGQNRFEDVSEMHRRHPLMNDYWRDKIAYIEESDIPAYVVASWTHPIHTKNSIAGFERLGTKDKWLRIHDTHEWSDLDSFENAEDLRKFFDHFLKGMDNGWETTPRVRYSVLDLETRVNQHKTTGTWPLPGVSKVTLYLDATKGILSETKPIGEGSISYDATSTDKSAAARFEYTVTKETEIHGPSNARFWVSTSGGSDMDLYACWYIEDKHGKVPFHVVFPGNEKKLRMMAAMIPKSKQLPGGAIYAGPNGRLRASHRGLDAAKSTDLAPYLTHETEEPVKAGEPVQVDLGIWPTGMLLHPSQKLVLEISGHVSGPVAEARATDSKNDNAAASVNQGKHTIYTGGKYQSVLFIPIVNG